MVKHFHRLEDLGLKRAPSAYALFCQHVARLAAPFPPVKRITGKTLCARSLPEKW